MRNTKVDSVEVKQFEADENFLNHSLPMKSMDTTKTKRTLNPIRTLSRITHARSVRILLLFSNPVIIAAHLCNGEVL